ncbi:MAG: DUF4342 domain-containing protein [Clostridiales Family XIII bacterium]|jgi:hypothetical protein|nr:DUF4342 domain-containing protein [Clostridiales Family XIII bacterium]
MKITIEQVEKLVNLTGVSYEEAKAALESADGDILEAIIALEKAGKTANRTGAYSTDGGAFSEAEPHVGRGGAYGQGAAYGGQSGAYGQGAEGCRGQGSGAGADRTSSFSEVMGKMWRFAVKVFHKGNINHFEVYRRGESILSIPVTILVIALVFLFWVTLPVLIIALFFGCRYRFRGPDLDRDAINNAMKAAANTAEDIKQSVKNAANTAEDIDRSAPDAGNGDDGRTQ